MRITRLYLKNFIAMNTAQGKREIEIIFPENIVINLLYGKMGSGKTFILGHCQPWHNLGTLDARNGDRQIVEGENGKKIIEYQNGANHYVITHDFIWSNKSHTIKHYIEKNGEELNENGNLGTFDEIIKLEFGIDPDYLKIIRIGSNVVNLISMKATERKKFMASIMNSSQIWLWYYKQLSQELRKLNTQSSILMKSLTDLDYTKIDEILEEYTSLEREIQELSIDEMEYREKIMAINGALSMIVADDTKESYKDGTISLRIKNLEKDLVTSKKAIESYKEDLSVLEGLTEAGISKELGEATGSLSIHEERRESLSEKYRLLQQEIESIQNKLSIMGNAQHKKNLRNAYQSLEIQVLNLEKDAQRYRYDYSYQNLIEILNTIESINRDLIYLSNFQLEDIIPILNLGFRRVKEAQRQVDVLRARLKEAQTETNNIQYSGTYKAPFKLFRAPFCPTKECPFYTTHPYTISKRTKKNEISNLVEARQSRLQELTTKIARYENYPTIYTYLENIKKSMEFIIPPLETMGLLKEHRIELIIGKQRNWVDGDTLVKYIELAQKRSELFTLRERLLSAKDQLNQIDMEDDSHLEKRLSSLQIEKDNLLEEIESLSKTIQDTKDTISKINEKYLKFMKAKQIIVELAQEMKRKETIENEIVVLEERMEKYESITREIISLEKERIELSVKLEKKRKDYLSETVRIEKIKDLQIQYQDVLKNIHYYTLITESVSPKAGIPLHLIGMYLNDCLDTINDLISGIFDDELEIEKFEPEEDSFYIPYNKNGYIVDDISKASQGETSIIGQSISFAIMENSMNEISYNIPLLDEPDGALHAEDRNRFLIMLLRHMKVIKGEQCIVISHNQTFEGYPIHLILTSDEDYVTTSTQTVTRI